MSWGCAVWSGDAACRAAAAGPGPTGLQQPGHHSGTWPLRGSHSHTRGAELPPRAVRHAPAPGRCVPGSSRVHWRPRAGLAETAVMLGTGQERPVATKGPARVTGACGVTCRVWNADKVSAEPGGVWAVAWADHGPAAAGRSPGRTRPEGTRDRGQPGQGGGQGARTGPGGAGSPVPRVQRRVL